ncbi:MAG: ABC transporter permease subunit, partial [Paracoccaceae bacterium]
ALPLGRLFMVSLEAPDFSLVNYVSFFNEGAYVRVLVQTVRVSVTVTLICIALGYPTAYVLARSRGKAQRLLILLVVIPYLTSFLVRTYAWIVLLNRRGVINSLLMETGVIDRPLDIIYNQFSVHVGLVHVMLPFMILPLYSVMKGIDLRLVQAAQAFGAGPLRAHLRAFLPLAMPGVRSGGLLVFLLCLGFFITPALLGGLRDVMLASFIEAQVSQLVQWGVAAAASFILLGVTLTGFFVVGRLIGANGLIIGGALTQKSDASGRSGWASWRAVLKTRLPWWRHLSETIFDTKAAWRARSWRRKNGRPAAFAILGVSALRLSSWMVLAYLAVPVLIVAFVSFSSADYLRFPPPGLSFRWYGNYLSDPHWLRATSLSLQVAVVTAAWSTIAGTLAAYALVRGRFWFKELAVGFIISPIIVPPIVIAVALYGQEAKLGLIGSVVGIAIGHSIIAVAYVVIIVSATLENLDRDLERAAMSLGAGPLRTFRRVTLPLIATGVGSSAIFAFIHSFDELVISLFVGGFHRQTLPVKMWENIQNEIDPTIAAVSTLVVLLPLVFLLLRRDKVKDMGG